jgi:GMP synthase-like glutamine amidotransferase
LRERQQADGTANGCFIEVRIAADSSMSMSRLGAIDLSHFVELALLARPESGYKHEKMETPTYLSGFTWLADGVAAVRVHYLMHVDFEPPGIIEKWARDRGHIFDGTLTSANKDIPDVADIDFLIVLGGPQSPLRMDDDPYLRDEINLISAMIRQNKPVIGFCLGSQLIAEALGARTRKSPHKEVGGFPVHLTEDGQKDPIFKDFPPEFEVIQWHHDMPGIPDGATLLARAPDAHIRRSGSATGFTGFNSIWSRQGNRSNPCWKRA